MDPKKRDELIAKVMADESRLFNGAVAALMFLIKVPEMQSEINRMKADIGLPLDVTYPAELGAWANSQLEKHFPDSGSDPM